jgi:hypothetical protein
MGRDCKARWSADGTIVSQENVLCPFQPRRVSNVIINEDEIVIAGRDGLLSQGSPAVQENVCRAIARAAEVTLSQYAAAFELPSNG